MGNPNTPPGHQGHTDQIPKRVSRWRRKAGPARGLVKISAVLSSVGTRRTAIMPSATYAWFSPSFKRCLRPCTPPVRLFSVYSVHVQPSIRQVYPSPPLASSCHVCRSQRGGGNRGLGGLGESEYIARPRDSQAPTPYCPAQA
eukprot:scaffold6568_cov126-Isochrysis_galbana.AAC.6